MNLVNELLCFHFYIKPVFVSDSLRDLKTLICDSMIEQDNQWGFTITSVGYSLASATLYTGTQRLHLPAHCCSASAL